MRVLVRLALGGSLAIGCGGGSGDPVDAAASDAPPGGDAASDAPVDVPDAAPQVTYAGTLTLVEAQVLGPQPAPVNTIIAEGIQLGITFTDSATDIDPVFDTNPGGLFGCKVHELTPAQVVTAAGANEGTVQFTVDNGGAPANPVYPPCVFVSGSGYACPDPSSSQALTALNSITLSQVNPQVSQLTVNGGTATFAGEDIGRYVKLSGTGTPFDASHVALPIIGLMSPTELILGAPAPAPVTTFTTGMMITLAGAGPQPGLVDPGQLADGASATAVLTPGGGNHFPATTITYANVGDDFTMDAANADLLRTIPTDGSGFTIGCATCGTSIGTVLSIVTTDTAVTGLGGTAMPAPTTKRVSIRCAEVGATSITVPASVSAYLMTSGATRIQTTFIRATFGTPNPSNPGLQGVISGHAIVGFTTP
jgi:hypothetical protein